MYIWVARSTLLVRFLTIVSCNCLGQQRVAIKCVRILFFNLRHFSIVFQLSFCTFTEFGYVNYMYIIHNISKVKTCICTNEIFIFIFRFLFKDVVHYEIHISKYYLHSIEGSDFLHLSIKRSQRIQIR